MSGVLELRNNGGMMARETGRFGPAGPAVSLLTGEVFAMNGDRISKRERRRIKAAKKQRAKLKKQVISAPKSK